MTNIIDKKIYEAIYYSKGQSHRIALFYDKEEAQKAIEEYQCNGYSASVNEISIVEVYSTFNEYMPKKAQENKQEIHDELKMRVFNSQMQEHDYEKLIKSYQVKLKYQQEMTERYKEELEKFEKKEILSKDGENIVYKTKFNTENTNER